MSTKVLDVGGWFRPYSEATHVVDLMPWETRRAKLTLDPLEGEKFTRESWKQVDFLQENIHLDYEDNEFDYVYCGHTIEDLRNPVPILKEMSRVGRRGIVRCPSRLSEQTVGVKDRENSLPGHPHHWWIVEADKNLKLFSKADSRLEDFKSTIPLTIYEKLARRNQDCMEVYFQWADEIEYEVISGASCADAARHFVAQCNVTVYDRLVDTSIRSLRRVRTMLKNNKTDDWWYRIVEVSKPYSSIELR